MSGSIITGFIPNDANYNFTTTLNEVNYKFDVHFNVSDDAWYFDMSDADGKVIIANVKVLLNVLFGRRCPHPFFDENVLVAIDTTTDDKEATFEDLGIRVFIKHMTKGEYIADLMAL
jgi:hypothetical protein